MDLLLGTAKLDRRQGSVTDQSRNIVAYVAIKWSFPAFNRAEDSRQGFSMKVLQRFITSLSWLRSARTSIVLFCVCV